MRRLRAELRQFREAAHHTQKSVADSLGWSTSKVIRIETGASNISTSDLMALLHFYGVNDAGRTQELLSVTRAKEESWWDDYKDVYSSQFLSYIAYEDSSACIRTFASVLVPGLLQTENYMRALFANALADPHEGMTASTLERAVRVRLRRQDLVTRDPAPETLVVLDEAVIHRWVGGADVMRDQLVRLKELARYPHIDLRIVPFTHGAHHGMKDSFAIFEFPSSDQDYVVNIEGPHRDTLVQNDPEISSRYFETFYELQEIATPEVDKIIDPVIDRMRTR
jgi:transcriptional regulator with XRE-family HTH domain